MKTDEFLLRELIIHRVPDKKVGTEARGPVLSQVAGDHPKDVRAYFQRRLRRVLNDRGQDVVVAADGDKRTTDAIRAIAEKPKLFVEQSKVLAQLLYDVQNGRNSAGILVVCLGSIEDRTAVGLLKLENERGVRAQEQQTDAGETFLQVTILSDLLLTDRTRVFKAAVFGASKKSQQLRGVAADEQVERNLASFFLRDFLGCELKSSPAVQTERYFTTVESYLGKIADGEERARCEIALLNQMQSRLIRTIDPVQFANEALGDATHQPFLDHLQEHGVPEQVFPKDTSTIESRIRRVAYGFESGIQLMGKPEAMDEHVTFGEKEGDTSRVIIKDRIVDVGSRH
ncbi:nucleoid-associated protein [Conexibacter sp. JD483]|uniref:nucleoid-associated protein n=1 Tax=unclassified Conexibacter TaxID=2627773 RepID=UPI002717F5BA|nr:MULTISPECIES: nucleoid-associated protein [unclassified Conexibacter]MDO8184657.1 nucleoid-associated protein [Conexibacter sp. CPCC 205706]MDO8197963.1 nucleoid-associated protein [Conexibacter sp. CPCC 205762]MDR9368393.1 nucleoid-associated protein [Conexibacter sp. JD483]